MADQHLYKNINGVGLGIVAFEGTELLYNTISEIRDLVTYVVVGLQKVSYHGDPISQVDYNEVIRLRDEDHLVDEIVEVELNPTKAPREQETDKRNMLIQHIQDHGCSHALIIDSDEYYTHKAFELCLHSIDESNWPVTYCQYINYWHDYEHYLVYPFQEGMYVPWVTCTAFRFSFESHDFKLPSDPTRRYVLPKHEVEQPQADGSVKKVTVYDIQPHVFQWNEIKMHHLSWIRANIRKKLNDWSSKKCFEGFEELIDKSVHRYGRFSDENMQEPAELLFNTPGHKVEIEKFPKQYIHPAVDIKTRLRECYQAKKTLVLVLSCDIEPFKRYEETIKQTWAKDIIDGKYPNVDFYFYKHKDGITETEIDEEHHMVWTACHDDLRLTFNKWQEAINFIVKQGRKYEYVLRMNSSTWCNFKALDRFIGYLDNEKVNYAGALYAAWWTFHRLYLSGTTLLLNWKDALVTVDQRWVPKGINENGIIDDVAISSCIFSRYLTIGVDYTEHFKSLGIDYEMKKDIVDEDQDWRDKFMHKLFITTKNINDADGQSLKQTYCVEVGYTIISENRDNECKKMVRIQEIYDSMQFTDDDIEQIRKNIVASEDTQIYMLNATKNDQMKGRKDTQNWNYNPANLVSKTQVIAMQEDLERADRADRT